MNLAWKGDVPGASGVDAQLRGALAWDGAKGSVEARKLDLTLGARAGAIQIAGSTLAIAAFAYDPAKQALRVEALELRVKGQRGKDALALDLDWPQLDVAGTKLAGSPLKGRAGAGRRTADRRQLQERRAERQLRGHRPARLRGHAQEQRLGPRAGRHTLRRSTSACSQRNRR